MKAGILLRIGIYIVGFYSLQTGLSWGLYYAHAALSDNGYGDAIIETSQSSIFGSAIFPLLFALACFGFAAKLERFLLGAASDSLVVLESASALLLAKIGIKLLGLYLFCTYGGLLISTFLELIAVRSGNTHFKQEQVTIDLISNGVSVGLGTWLVLQTDRVLKRFFTQS